MDDLKTSPSSVRPVLVLTRREIVGLMSPADYLTAVELGFRASAAGEAHAPSPMHLGVSGGGFHVKGAAFSEGGSYAAFKVNGNFPENRQLGLPTIQGAIVLCDAADGSLLAVMDSIEITLQRTAAASALAARFLARGDAATVTICGCGDQGRVQLAALAEILPLRRALVFDRDPQRAAAFAQSCAPAGVRVVPVAELRGATLSSDVIVTCTTSRQAFLGRDDVRAGSFVAAVGADNPDKSEIEPALMASATVVADVIDQAETMGDLHHALRAGVMTSRDVRGDLAGLVAGTVRGRSSDAEITIFDSTGSALQDVASAASVYQKALAGGAGSLLPLGAP